MEEVASKVKDILVEKMGIAETEVTPDANLIKDLGIDSLDYAELVMEFEHTFDIRIPDEDAEKMATVGDAINFFTIHEAPYRPFLTYKARCALEGHIVAGLPYAGDVDFDQESVERPPPPGQPRERESARGRMRTRPNRRITDIDPGD